MLITNYKRNVCDLSLRQAALIEMSSNLNISVGGFQLQLAEVNVLPGVWTLSRSTSHLTSSLYLQLRVVGSVPHAALMQITFV